MYKLSFITFLAFILSINVFAQTSPHGNELTTKCDVCHISKNWKTIVIKKDSFNHNTITTIPLTRNHNLS